jgi:hypothetical protein
MNSMFSLTSLGSGGLTLITTLKFWFDDEVDDGLKFD